MFYFIFLLQNFIYALFFIAIVPPSTLLGNDIVKIAKDIRDAHSKDAETGEATTPVDYILDSFEELKTADNIEAYETLLLFEDPI